MFFPLERAGKFAQELKGYIYPKEINLSDFVYKEGNYSGIAAVEQAALPWKECIASEIRWGGRNRHGWFRTRFRIPEDFNDKTVAIRVAAYTGAGLVEDATNPQFILYINQQLIQGLDINHQEVILERNAVTGNEYQIDLHAYSGMLDKKTDVGIQLVIIDEQTRAFFYDLTVAVEIARELAEDQPWKHELIRIITSVVNLLDLRKPFSAKFYASLHQAAELLKNEFYDKTAGHEEIIATCIGHSHIDVAWLWTLEQTREKVTRSFTTVLKLMEEYPDYVYISSQPQLYQFIKEDHPEIYARIKERIAEGRWEAEGAMWLEADCNLTSGESLVRQILFGTRFFAREFNIENEVLWLPDVFGYSAALPQILKKSGIRCFLTTKISWNQFNRIPYDTFMWRGIDGTEILTYFINTIYPGPSHHPYGATYNSLITPHILAGSWERYQQKDLNNDILIAYGFGDGGGGPTAEMLEYASRLKKGLPGCPSVKLGKVSDFVAKLAAKVADEKYLPKWAGELYLELHRGTYTSMGRNKRYNRKSELLYQDVEFLAVMAMILGEEYPQARINQGWETILLNQFHDILPGSAIKEVYETSSEQYEALLYQGKGLAAKSLDAVASRIGLEQPSVVVYNTLAFERNDLVMLELPADPPFRSVIDATGTVLPLQTVTDGCNRQVMFHAQGLPSKGYQTFTLSPLPAAASAMADAGLSVSPAKLENQYFLIEIDSKGTISSLYDKVNERQVLQAGQRGNKLQAFEDKPLNWDNWDIDIYYQEKEWEIDAVAEVAVLEAGPVRGGLLIKKKFQDSTVIQKIYIYRDIARIDFDTWVDWREDQLLLKVAFPVDVHADKATYDIQFGNVERPTHWNTSWDWARFEVCAQKWADVSEEGFGVSLLNDCKYGYDIKEGNMRLTLLKSGNDPNPQADREEHHFVYSLFPHAGDWRDGKTVQMAYRLNVPLYAKFEEAHFGSYPAQFAFFALDQENVILETVKKAEDSGAVILRLFECHHKRSKVKLTCYNQLAKVWECNLMEKELGQLTVSDNSFEFDMKPYEIKTFKLDFLI